MNTGQVATQMRPGVRPSLTRKLGEILLLSLAAMLVGVPDSFAETPASKNRKGNQLFDEGKYQEAERAYLEAQAELPDRPELFYNLGNSLIKQKKYDQALQSLGQAESKGDKTLQYKSWYNIGNALYEMGNFQESAQSYIQVLRIEPSDRDAKHNLELALKKIQQQQQMGTEQNQQSDQQNPESPDQPNKEGEDRSGDEPDESGKTSPESEDNQDETRTANPQSSRPERREGAFTREQALQMLDALQNQELAEQRKLLQRRARRKALGWDW